MSKLALEKAQESKGDLDMTSMIDVVFLLLIFFMCTIKFKVPEASLRSYLPRDRGTQTGNPTLTKGCRITIWKEGGEIIVLADEVEIPHDDTSNEFAEKVSGQPWMNEPLLEDHIMRRRDTYVGYGDKGLPVIIDFGADVPWNYVVRTLNICRRLDIQDVAFAAPEEAYD